MKIYFLSILSFLIFVSCDDSIKLQSQVYNCTFTSECPSGMSCAGFSQLANTEQNRPRENSLAHERWGLCVLTSDLPKYFYTEGGVEVCDNNKNDTPDNDSLTDCDDPKCNVACYIDLNLLDPQQEIHFELIDCYATIEEMPGGSDPKLIPGPCDANK